MYPRNAASPERLAIGAVVQISDGAVQTSGVSVKVMPQGGAASAGGGTIAYEEGIVHYLPTQAETDYTSFILIAYKTGCIPASTTVVTTDSATPGTVKLAGVTHTGATVPTVTTLTGHTAQTGDTFARLGAPAGASIAVDIAAVKTQTAAIEVDTQDIQSRLPAALVSGRMDSSVGAMAANVLTATAIAADAITDAKVASDVTIASVTGAVGSVTGNVGGNVTGSVGSVTGLTPSSIADQVWDEAISGHLTVGTTGAALNGATAPTAAAIADAVWDEAISGHTTSGSTGEALSAAGASGDPWITSLPGSYSAGQAGYILGTNLNATVSSRLATAGYTAPLDAAGTRSAIGLASANLDTQLGDLPTNAELATALGTADDAVLSAISGLTIPTAIENADALLARDLGSGSNAGTLNERTVRSALRFIRNKWTVASGTLDVKKEDDSTTAWTGAVTASPGADPISGNDPT